MGLIGIWFNHVTIAHKNVLFDVYFGFPESHGATNNIQWVKRYLNHHRVLRLFSITITICTDWLMLCLFFIQCKYRLWVIGIFIFMMQVLIKIVFRNYTLWKRVSRIQTCYFLVYEHCKSKQALCSGILQWWKDLHVQDWKKTIIIRIVKCTQTKRKVILNIKTRV